MSKAEESNVLGEYLRARRGLVKPGDVGIVASSRRRVPGLTREEVAVRAGVSVEYYTRLEQGGDRRPSPAIVSSLSRALNLSASATDYLADLALISLKRNTQLARVDVPENVVFLISAWQGTPAFVIDRLGNVVAAGPLVGSLTPACTLGRNMFREIFLNPDARNRYVNWDNFSAVLVAGLRSTIGRALDSDDVTELITDLAGGSSRFRELWRRQDAAPGSGGSTTIRHPTEGIVKFRVTNLMITGSELTLVVYQPEPGSSDEAAMQRIRSGLLSI